MIEELLKELKEKAQELSNEHWGDDERHLVGKGIQCMYVQTENIIRSKLKDGGWIPCSERLPEIDGMYLITAKVLQKIEVQYVWFQKNEKIFVCNGIATAWQPLPEAYHG